MLIIWFCHISFPCIKHICSHTCRYIPSTCSLIPKKNKKKQENEERIMCVCVCMRLGLKGEGDFRNVISIESKRQCISNWWRRQQRVFGGIAVWFLLSEYYTRLTHSMLLKAIVFAMKPFVVWFYNQNLISIPIQSQRWVCVCLCVRVGGWVSASTQFVRLSALPPLSLSLFLWYVSAASVSIINFLTFNEFETFQPHRQTTNW